MNNTDQGSNDTSEEARKEEICGVVTRIVYRSEDTGYTVCCVKSARDASGHEQGALPFGRREGGAAADGEVTVVGSCAAVWVGESLKATGRWIHHKKHGYQFNAEQMMCLAPVTAEGIRMYLASGTIKGIGPVMAQRLADAFGDDTLRIIDKESERLLEVPGLGAKTRGKIKESWNAQKRVRDIMIFLRGHGVGTAQSARIHRQYGDDAIAVIVDNPYRLCREVWGIGFKSADQIAISIGIPHESDIRARAGILYVLQTMADEGHCFCPWDVLVEEGQALLNIPSDTLNRAVIYGKDEGSLIEDSGNIYLVSLYNAEVSVAERIGELLRTPGSFRPIDVEKAVPWAQKRMGISFAQAQVEALHMALSQKVSIITGGPGVGKTTIIRAIVDIFHARDLAVFLAAPTGRAAKRLSEATQCPAQTIHRLLRFQPGTKTFEHGRNNPLPGDVFILDEVSMVDIYLMDVFLQALPPRGHLILVGDSDQLPSVGPGNVLKDMIGSGVLASRTLQTIFRQREQSWIVHNAHRVNRGESLEFPAGDSATDFYLIRADDPETVIQRMLEVVTKRIPERFGFNPIQEIQVLTPMRRNELGCDNLNGILQEALNPSGDSLKRFGRTYRTGDRVMQIRNNYDKEVFNGDIGVVTEVDDKQERLVVDFDGHNVEYDHTELDELVLAYACSIHKSQGSEYPAVVVLLATQHYKLLQRNLLYTALTRGRKLVCLIGSQKAVHIAIRNNQTLLRRTSLARRLSAGVRA